MRRQSQGFSLLEMIGVMAVMAILAGALAPAIFQMIDDGYQTAEIQSMETLRTALEDAIRSNKEIPSAKDSDWTTAVADFAGFAPSRVLYNDKNFKRRLYVDPKFFSKKNKAFKGYVQNQGLASKPHSPRMMLVSNLEGNIKTKLNNNKQFSAVWEQTKKAKIKESKTLIIERINLAPLFKRVVLSNSFSSQTGFELEGGKEGAIAAASGGSDGSRTLYVIAATRIDLNAAPYPGGATQRQLIVQNDTSLRYQTDGGSWYWDR